MGTNDRRSAGLNVGTSGSRNAESGKKERSFDPLHSLRIRILIGCVERSLVAMLLGIEILRGISS